MLARRSGRAILLLVRVALLRLTLLRLTLLLRSLLWWRLRAVPLRWRRRFLVLLLPVAEFVLLLPHLCRALLLHRRSGLCQGM